YRQGLASTISSGRNDRYGRGLETGLRPISIGDTPTARSAGTCEADNRIAGGTIERFGVFNDENDKVLRRMGRAGVTENKPAGLCGIGGGDFSYHNRYTGG